MNGDCMGRFMFILEGGEMDPCRGGEVISITFVGGETTGVSGTPGRESLCAVKEDPCGVADPRLPSDIFPDILLDNPEPDSVPDVGVGVTLEVPPPICIGFWGVVIGLPTFV